MKRSIVLFSFMIVPFLTGCKKSGIDMPRSPFEDSYKRIGMRGEYSKTDDMNQADYNAIKAALNDSSTTKDINVSKYKQVEQIRDLKYAYFGKESSTISQCSSISQSADLQRYGNRVMITTNRTNRQIQTANGGVQKSYVTLTNYTYDDEMKIQDSGNYTEIIETKNNEEEPKITKNSGSYNGNADIYDLFGLKPYDLHIRSHFYKEGDEGKYRFKLLANDNNAVYYKHNDQYLIKEGYSLFSEFNTTMGRSYKAQDNYFYEGLLRKDIDGNSNKEIFRFTYFRYYHELLILSKSIDGEGVPVLYLDKPVLIEFSETTYSDIEYYDNEADLDNYTGKIPSKI